jgi:hypothetical protein
MTFGNVCTLWARLEMYAHYGPVWKCMHIMARLEMYAHYGPVWKCMQIRARLEMYANYGPFGNVCTLWPVFLFLCSDLQNRNTLTSRTLSALLPYSCHENSISPG